FFAYIGPGYLHGSPLYSVFRIHWLSFGPASGGFSGIPDARAKSPFLHKQHKKTATPAKEGRK
ncbi:hypothetical protein, partial [Paenibacillus phytohabitans]|uniref:hypothetical protein n=1 Tax=Paenibacillus phytohabitans TaxID=2654978 RepID=UPI00300B7343